MTAVEQQRIALATGVELDVWTEGDPASPPIIFLHGFPESHRTWRHQMAGLVDRFWCIAPDQRGYARSSKPPEVRDYMVPKLVADVFALADALGIDRFTLAAHDWGGAIGWAAALTRPERVERLIIANAPHPYIYQKTIIEDLDQRQAAQYIRTFRGDELERRIAENGLGWFFECRGTCQISRRVEPARCADRNVQLVSRLTHRCPCDGRSYRDHRLPAKAIPKIDGADADCLGDEGPCATALPAGGDRRACAQGHSRPHPRSRPFLAMGGA
jgi:pimeloyl-ACP methyl ester carboxylesterase